MAAEDTKEDPPQAAPAPAVPVTPTPEPPATSSTMTLSPEEIAMIHQHRNQRQESPTKKAKPSPEDHQDWNLFLAAFSDKDIEIMDLDPQLRNSLQNSKQARDDFLSINLLSDHAQHLNPETKALETIDLSKERPFETSPLLLPQQESDITEAMKQYHQTTIMPSFQALTDACKQFYSTTVFENHYAQLKFGMHDPRITTLEARVSRRRLLLKGLPSWGFNKANLDWNISYWLKNCGLSMEKCSLHHQPPCRPPEQHPQN